MNESALVKRILSALNELPEMYAKKIHGGPYQSAGLPDIIFCYKGLYGGLEVKLPGKEKTLTPKQAYNLKKIKEAGGFAEMVTSVGEALEMVTQL